MLIKEYPQCEFPHRFKYDPPASYVINKRPLLFSELKRVGSKAGILRVEPGEEFVLSKDEYMRLFMKETGPAYSHEFIKPLGPVKVTEQVVAEKVKK